jgi:hypothetical protein
MSELQQEQWLQAYETPLRYALKGAMDPKRTSLSEFFSEVESILEPHRNIEITRRDLGVFSELMGNSWSFGFKDRDEITYAVAKRNVSPKQEIDELYAKHSIAGQRVFGSRTTSNEPTKPSLITRGYFTGDDLIAIINFERDLVEVGDEMQLPKPKASERPSPYNREESSLILTPQEAKFLGSLALTNAEISKRVGIHPTDQFRLFSNAQRKNNLAKDELIMAAFEEKLIDMRPLDTRDLTVLTPKEIHMMHRCVQDSSNGPKQRHNSIAQLRATGILQKLGNISYEQLLLLGLRDGIVSRGVGATRLTPDE